jgi:hypothetical protein
MTQLRIIFEKIKPHSLSMSQITQFDIAIWIVCPGAGFICDASSSSFRFRVPWSCLGSARLKITCETDSSGNTVIGKITTRMMELVRIASFKIDAGNRMWTRLILGEVQPVESPEDNNVSHWVCNPYNVSCFTVHCLFLMRYYSNYYHNASVCNKQTEYNISKSEVL